MGVKLSLPFKRGQVKPLEQQLVEAFLDAHRATGSGLAVPMSPEELKVAMRGLLRKFKVVKKEESK